MSQHETPLGKPQRRVDGRAKVTGSAIYAGEAEAEGLLHGVVVSSAIARGTIRTIDTSAALAVPGVVTVFTHENRPSLAWFDRSYRDDDAPAGSPLRPLRSADIAYSGQPIARRGRRLRDRPLRRHAARDRLRSRNPEHRSESGLENPAQA